MVSALQSFADQTAAACRDTYGNDTAWNEILEARLLKVISDTGSSDSDRAAALAVVARACTAHSTSIVDAVFELLCDETQTERLRMRAVRTLIACDALTELSEAHVNLVVFALFHDRIEHTSGLSTSVAYVDFFSGEADFDTPLRQRDHRCLDAVCRLWPTLGALALSQVVLGDTGVMIRSEAVRALIALSANHGPIDSLMNLTDFLRQILCSCEEDEALQDRIVKELFRYREKLGSELWFGVARDISCASSPRVSALQLLYRGEPEDINRHWGDLIDIATDINAPLEVRTESFQCLHRHRCIISIPECIAILYDSREKLLVKGTILSISSWPPKEGLSKRLCTLIPTLELEARRIALNVLSDVDLDAHLTFVMEYVQDMSYWWEWQAEIAVSTARAHPPETVARVIQAYSGGMSFDADAARERADRLIRYAVPSRHRDEDKVLLAAHQILIPDADITRLLLAAAHVSNGNPQHDEWLIEFLRLASVRRILESRSRFFSRKGVDLDIDEMKSLLAFDILVNVQNFGRPIRNPYWMPKSLQDEVISEVRRIIDKHAKREFRYQHPQFDKVARPLRYLGDGGDYEMRVDRRDYEAVTKEFLEFVQTQYGHDVHRIVQMKLEGALHADIAARLGVCVRTITRQLQRVESGIQGYLSSDI